MQKQTDQWQTFRVQNGTNFSNTSTTTENSPLTKYTNSRQNWKKLQRPCENYLLPNISSNFTNFRKTNQNNSDLIAKTRLKWATAKCGKVRDCRSFIWKWFACLLWKTYLIGILILNSSQNIKIESSMFFSCISNGREHSSDHKKSKVITINAITKRKVGNCWNSDWEKVSDGLQNGRGQSSDQE